MRLADRVAGARSAVRKWEPLAPKLVVEVKYDHFSGHRFRYGTKLLHWRPDKHPQECKISQVKRESESPPTLLE